METVLLSAGVLTRFIAIQSVAHRNRGYTHYNRDGIALVGEESVFSEKVKIEAERATVNDRYVNLRFCHSNRYWSRRGDRIIVALSNKPEEDTTKSTCTLFEAVSVAGGNVYLVHVQSRGRVMVEQPSMRFYVNANPSPTDGYLSIVNWNTIVKLPKHVAFKGDNGKYLHAAVVNRNNFLKFHGEDPNDAWSGNEVSLMPDGHVRIKNLYFDRFWRRSPNWIWADTTDTTANNRDTLFWPVKIDETTIALRNAGNNNFCKRLTAENNVSCLNAAVANITTEARLVMEELVLRRKIHNVRYRMEDARIFNETPYLAGTTTAYNYSDSEAAIAVEVSYEDSKSRSFSRSLSLSAGVETTIEAGVPLITSASIAVSYQISGSFEWNDTKTETITTKATGSVPVPPRSVATVTYVGSMGTCDVPFSYTQEDTNSTNGRITETDKIDGVFRGVNYYNLEFKVDKTRPL